MTTVLVTGASGFLGRDVVRQLVARRVHVRALVRPATDPRRANFPAEVEVFRADLRANVDLAPAFDGVDVLVHLAAAVVGDAQTQFASSVVGTERLLAAMVKSQTRTLVLASSFSVYDFHRAPQIFDEDAPLEAAPSLYDRDGYAIAKVWQERVAREVAAEHGLDLRVLRPGFIWGKDNADIAGIGHPMGRLLLVVGRRSRTMPLTHVENCADCFAVVALDDRAAGQTFNVVDDAGASAVEYADRLLRSGIRQGRALSIPYEIAYNAGRLALATSRALFRGKGKLPSILIPLRFEARFRPFTYTNAKLATVLGWSPPHSYDECLRRTFGDAPLR